MVTVMRGGEEVKISKRAGSYVTVRDLIDEVGRDAVRYFFLMRKGDSQLVFDVDLARTQSEENPVYYMQMAHARMCGIFRVGEIDRETFDATASTCRVLREPEEQELIKALLDFPAAGRRAPPKSLEPHRIAGYLHRDRASRASLVSQAPRARRARADHAARDSHWRARRRSCSATGSRCSGSPRPSDM